MKKEKNTFNEITKSISEITSLDAKQIKQINSRLLKYAMSYSTMKVGK